MNCTRLKEARKRTGLSQANLGVAIGLSQYTISRLESDTTAWSRMDSETTDKIHKFFEQETTGKFRKVQKPNEEKKFEPIKSVEKNVEPKVEKVEKVHKPAKKDELTELDSKTMTLIEFAYEGLKEASTNEEFEASINLLKRIVSKY